MHIGIVYGLRVNIELVLNVSELQNENNTNKRKVNLDNHQMK